MKKKTCSQLIVYVPRSFSSLTLKNRPYNYPILIPILKSFFFFFKKFYIYINQEQPPFLHFGNRWQPLKTRFKRYLLNTQSDFPLRPPLSQQHGHLKKSWNAGQWVLPRGLKVQVSPLNRVPLLCKNNKKKFVYHYIFDSFSP